MQKQKDYDFNINCDEAADVAIGSIEDGEEAEISNDVLESLFDCLICHRPFLVSRRKAIKMCGRPRCRYITT